MPDQYEYRGDLLVDSIVALLSADHGRCDDLFYQAEFSVEKGRWELAVIAYRKFKNALLHHLEVEEEVLFPAMEETASASNGPIHIMRSEHQQMLQLLHDMEAAINERNAKEFMGHSETLNIMMQQHNFKEEHMLYRMADQMLAARREQIFAAIENIQEPA